jgi:two-component system, NtrC family, sensor kinase
VNIPDVFKDPHFAYGSVARAANYRSVLAVPMMRDGEPVGVILATRPEAGPFSGKETELLRTFADQAVIAIENVRLFKELDSSNRELRVALEQQTATAEVLKLISRSTFDLRPILETLIEHAARLCRAEGGCIYRKDGELHRLAAAYNMSPEHRDFVQQNPVTPGRGTAVGRAILERRPVHIHDVKADPNYTHGAVGIGAYRTLLGVPMMREDIPIGVFAVWRTEVLPFTDKQIELVTTFADQGAIAIANVRLLSELQARTAELTRSVDELTALGEVARALSSTLNLEDILQTIVSRATQLTETAGCVIWEYDKPQEEFRLRVSHYTDDTDAAILPARGGVTAIPKGQGLTTQVMEERHPMQISDITLEGAYESAVRQTLIDAGIARCLACPC